MTASDQAPSPASNPGSLKARLGRVPTPLGGLALGVASLGSAWAIVLPEYGNGLKLISALIAALLVMKVILKFLLHPKLFREDLRHPVISSVIPTCAMALMVISQALLPYIGHFARVLWVSAVAAHLILLVEFVRNRLASFRFEDMAPSWFVPPVGIIVAAVTSPGMGFESLTWFLFVFGLGCYSIKLPIMLYRLLFKGVLPDSVLPTFAILAAPASLSLAGYLTIAEQPNFILMAVLAPLAILMTGVVYIGFVRLFRLPFSPGYAAFTFPMAIGATAMLKLSEVLNQGGNAVYRIGLAELLIATVIVFYVLIRYAHHYLKPSI